jgi:ABC-type phosphate transport system substrate-binding protein
MFVAVCCLPALSVRAGDKPEPLAIVVKKGSKFTQTTTDELAKIFKGDEKSSSDGTHFVLTLREPHSPEQTAFLDEVLHMSEAEFQKYFLQAMFTGKVKNSPKVISSADALKSFMESNDGAIGYVKLSDADDSFTVVAIDGKKPGDDGYPLTLK